MPIISKIEKISFRQLQKECFLIDFLMNWKAIEMAAAIEVKINMPKPKRNGIRYIAGMARTIMMAQTHVGSPSFSGLVFLFEELLDELEPLLDVPLDSPVRSSKS